jgi:hypothetical protein
METTAGGTVDHDQDRPPSGDQRPLRQFGQVVADVGARLPLGGIFRPALLHLLATVLTGRAPSVLCDVPVQARGPPFGPRLLLAFLNRHPMSGAPFTPGGIFLAANLALTAALHTPFIALGIEGLACGLFLASPVPCVALSRRAWPAAARRRCASGPHTPGSLRQTPAPGIRTPGRVTVGYRA